MNYNQLKILMKINTKTLRYYYADKGGAINMKI